MRSDAQATNVAVESAKEANGRKMKRKRKRKGKVGTTIQKKCIKELNINSTIIKRIII